MHWTLETWESLSPEEKASWFAFFEVNAWRLERERLERSEVDALGK